LAEAAADHRHVVEAAAVAPDEEIKKIMEIKI
jgi:hypothetical protein